MEHEVKRLAFEATGKTWETLSQSSSAPDWARKIHWGRLGDQFLSSSNMKWFLQELDQHAKVDDLESRVKVHLDNVKYAFEMRMKNLALAVGLGLCLLCDINAVTIWKSLYADEQLRATFATSYADKASAMAQDQAKEGTNSGQKSPNEQAKAFKSCIQSFLTDVSFGVGQIWRPIPPNDKPIVHHDLPLRSLYMNSSGHC